ncbi:MAG: HAD family hydrolase [Hallerella porci]|uniref:Haloacid dehalogenase-like hydrolase n=1 Tax=Hallerella porci TaxID=1945871 RepID=A0ABX5LJW7_9BACT|nr:MULTISPECIES: HAD family hydrolase [Fibrobacteraceae]MCI5599978.1 haloacid dehalogenase-like hydrolase [Hallerella sp.]MDY3921937.1 HAD family hydrolase [Hallerella porci]PWK97296.1 haloacid dehalogenase-like hydrolase [Hallerella porci]
MEITRPFEQNVIAMVWDFDKTLIRDYMQVPLFKRYGIDSKQFWDEVNALPEFYAKKGIHINRDTSYLNHILTYVKAGKMRGLSNQILRDCGKELELFPGLPEFFPKIKSLVEENEKFQKAGIKLEHYVVSTGFAETIRGSAVAPYLDGIFGCEFIEEPAQPGFLTAAEKALDGEISQVASALDNTSKTRYLFEINKGANKFETIDVNSQIAKSNRRIPFENMIYIADGPSDVPAFSILNQSGGVTYAIYPAHDRMAMRQVDALRKDHRIQMYGEADYTEDSMTWMWLSEQVLRIAENLVAKQELNIRKSASKPPAHLN